MLAGMALFTIFCIPVAVGKSLTTILVGRFLCGVTGVAPIALFGGGLVDIWHPEQRAIAMATVIGIVLGGPLLAPVMGSFITASHLGWRWTGWLSCIMGGSCTILVFFGLPETYPPIILQKRQDQSEKRKTGGWHRFVRVYLVRPFGKPYLRSHPVLLLIDIYSVTRHGTHPGPHDALPSLRLRHPLPRILLLPHHIPRTAPLEARPLVPPLPGHDGRRLHRLRHDRHPHRPPPTSKPAKTIKRSPIPNPLHKPSHPRTSRTTPTTNDGRKHPPPRRTLHIRMDFRARYPLGGHDCRQSLRRLRPAMRLCHGNDLYPRRLFSCGKQRAWGKHYCTIALCGRVSVVCELHVQGAWCGVGFECAWVREHRDDSYSRHILQVWASH